MAVRYMSRADWGGGSLRRGYRVDHRQFVGEVAHHAVAVMADYDRDGFLHGDLDDIARYMRFLQVARPDLGSEVPYSFVVFERARAGDCVVAEGRGWGVTGAHTAGYNSTRYGVAVAGNTSTRPVTDGMLDGYRWVGSQLANPRTAVPTIGHRDTKATECPGHDLYSKLRLVQPPFTAPLPPPVEEEEDVKPFLVQAEDDDAYWVIDPVLGRRWVNDGVEARVLKGQEMVNTAKDGGPHRWNRESIESFPLIPGYPKPAGW